VRRKPVDIGVPQQQQVVNVLPSLGSQGEHFTTSQLRAVASQALRRPSAACGCFAVNSRFAEHAPSKLETLVMMARDEDHLGAALALPKDGGAAHVCCAAAGQENALACLQNIDDVATETGLKNPFPPVKAIEQQIGAATLESNVCQR